MVLFLLNIQLLKMMNSFIKNVFNLFDLEIKRINKESTSANIKSKKTDKLTLHSTSTGSYYLPSDAISDVVANTIIAGDIFEKSVVDLASNYIKPNSTVLDVGSNYGQMSILFSKLVGSKGKVHAFEANSWIYEILNKNIKVNGKSENIISHFGAVHDVDNVTLIFSDIDFVEWGAYGSYGIDYNVNVGQEVSSITIDSFCFEEPISFMKIDIQGGDLNAMKGAIETIRKHQMPILFEYEYHFEDKFNFNFQQYVDFVNSINYKFHKVINGHNFLIIPK